MKNKHELDNWSKLENLVLHVWKVGASENLKRTYNTNIHNDKFIDL